MEKKTKKIRKWFLCMMIVLAAVLGTSRGTLPVEVQAAAVETPTRLRFSGGMRSGTLSWNKVKGASGYRVYRKVDGKRWKVMTLITNGSITYYDDKRLRDGTCYVYTVRAYKKVNGKTLWSGCEKDGVRIVSGLTVPTITVKKSTAKECTVDVTIRPVDGAHGYCIYRRSSSSEDWKKIGQTTGSTYEDTNLKPGFTYLYTARAYCKYYGKAYYSGSNRRGVPCKVMETNPYYAKVKNYILKKGYTDKNGLKFVRTVLAVDGVKIQWRVYYDQKEDSLELIQLSEGKDYHDKMRMVLNETPLKVSPGYSIYTKDMHLYADASFEAASYSGKHDEWFHINAFVGNEPAELEDYEAENEAVNDILRLAFAGWEELLNSKVKVSLKKLGFRSYVPLV